MKERIKQLRKTLKLTQVEFGEKLGLKGNTITNYENGLRVPSDAVILSICREFDVNENWLRTGNGNMFLPEDRHAEIARITRQLLNEEEDSFKNRFVAMLADLSVDEWEYLEKIAVKLSSQKKDKKIYKETTPSEKSIDEKVEDYRHQLELEEKAKEKSSVLQKNA